MRDTIVGQTTTQQSRVYIGVLDDEWRSQWLMTLDRSQALGLYCRLGDVLGERRSAEHLRGEVEKLERSMRGLRGALKRRKRVAS